MAPLTSVRARKRTRVKLIGTVCKRKRHLVHHFTTVRFRTYDMNTFDTTFESERGFAPVALSGHWPRNNTRHRYRNSLYCGVPHCALRRKFSHFNRFSLTPVHARKNIKLLTTFCCRKHALINMWAPVRSRRHEMNKSNSFCMSSGNLIATPRTQSKARSVILQLIGTPCLCGEQLPFRPVPIS